MKEKLATDSLLWKKNGCTDLGLLNTKELFAAKCWLMSKGAKYEGYSQEMIDFVNASSKALGEEGNWDFILRQRAYCSGCGERYKLENLSVCCSCYNFDCYRCTGDYGVHTNGNLRCSCGGEIVG